ncbi:hypothetical protein DBY21_06415 [Candidatus Gastranaerophilales bacterium]|nr:MAG: hypothetical protein DBY21_06415 [Candidatus Gastranaerophilales bacterium]
MKIDKTNNLQSSQKRQMVYTAAGIGAGAVAGGAFGYLQKPWIKDGEVTDAFIKNVNKNDNNLQLKKLKQVLEDLKQIARTGNSDNIQEIDKANWYNNTPLEKRKSQALSALDELKEETNAENYDDIYNKYVQGFKTNELEYQQKRIDDLKAIKISDEVSVDEIVNIFKEKIPNSIPCLDEGTTLKQYVENNVANDKTLFIKDLKKRIQNNIENDQAKIDNYKNSIKSYIDTSGKKLKDIPAEADEEGKILYDATKKTINDMNWKNAGKWAGIGAVALGVIGLGTAVLTGKKNS